MMRVEKIIFCSLVLLCCSCNNPDNSSKNKFSNSVVGFRLSCAEEMESNFDSLFLDNRTLIVAYVDSCLCTSCYFKDFQKYNMHNLESHMTDLVFVVSESIYTKMGIDSVLKQYGLDYLVLLDVKGHLKQNNDFLHNPVYNVFVIDRDYNIIWLGSPIKNEDTWNLFLAEIKKYK